MGGQASADPASGELEWLHDRRRRGVANDWSGMPRPRKTMLAAQQGGRLHHAWLLTGPRGIGKATLAWRFARFLLNVRGAGS